MCRYYLQSSVLTCIVSLIHWIGNVQISWFSEFKVVVFPVLFSVLLVGIANGFVLSERNDYSGILSLHNSQICLDRYFPSG